MKRLMILEQGKLHFPPTKLLLIINGRRLNKCTFAGLHLQNYCKDVATFMKDCLHVDHEKLYCDAGNRWFLAN